MVCSNYKNPLQAMTVTGFSLTVSDREAPNNLVAVYPEFELKIAELEPRQLDGLLQFHLQEMELSDQENQDNRVSVQTEVALTLEFDMGDIPIDNLGCFTKFTFPSDMPLPSTPLRAGYISSSYPGHRMLLPLAGKTLTSSDYFIAN